MNDIIQNLQSVLKKQHTISRKSLKSFLFSVIAVINKVKPSYLVDGILCSPAQLCQLVQYIGSHCPTQIDGLTVLHFPDGDLVVTDVEQCLLNVQESFKCFQNGLLSSKRNLQVVQAFINITSTLKKPHVIYKQTDHGYEEIKDIYCICLSTLEKAVVFKKNDGVCAEQQPAFKVKLLQIDIGRNHNLATVFGILLNYPCVYWYDTLLSHENCLSCCSLNVCRFGICANSESNKFQIFSFSYPSALHDIVNDYICVWKHKIQSCTLKGYYVTYEELTKTLTSVVL